MSSSAHPRPSDSNTPRLRLVAWETTRNCNLSCQHCRASARHGSFSGELDTTASLRLLDQIARAGSPIVILTGGEPLLRPDIFEIAGYGTELGLKMVMAPNGTLITEQNARQMKESGIDRISVSLDGATAESHDRFRGVAGAFEGALAGAELARKAGVEFQINTTITRNNMDEIPAIMKLAEQSGAVAHHIFLLVPTGRGKELAEQAITAADYENTLNWFYDQRRTSGLQLKATCAPQYYRILRQRARRENIKISFQSHGLDAVTRGCLGGVGFCFISHRGVVQPCGFLELNCGDVTVDPFDRIWEESVIFQNLRDYDNLKGKCGLCEYRAVCGGCRARAYEATGDYLAEEPLCAYQPGRAEKALG
ncbi:MAG: heme b synthase [Desulfosudaceae bacterium]